MTDCTHERNLSKLRKDFEEVFLAALADSETVEIVLNSDGSLWHERLGEPLKKIGTMSASSADAAIRALASYHHTTVTRENPSIECELPLDGSRFAGQIPPLVSSPVFAVRKRASRVFTLEQYVEAGIITPEQKEFLCEAVKNHRNVLITGSTGSGKSTLLNGIIHELTDQFPNERLVIIEDTAEIQIQKPNVLRFEARREQNGVPAVTIRDLLKATLRHRPDRIMLGEIRGGEAFDLLQLLNTGHGGTISTVHANSAAQGISRFTTCVVQSGVEMPYRAIKTNIAESLNVIIQIERRPGSRYVSEVLEIRGYDPEADKYDLGTLYLHRSARQLGIVRHSTT